MLLRLHVVCVQHGYAGFEQQTDGVLKGCNYYHSQGLLGSAQNCQTSTILDVAQLTYLALFALCELCLFVLK